MEATTTTTRAVTPAAVIKYFSARGIDASNAVVEQTLIPGRGWRRRDSRERVTRPLVRQLSHHGVTQVTVRAGNTSVDFRIDALIG